MKLSVAHVIGDEDLKMSDEEKVSDSPRPATSPVDMISDSECSRSGSEYVHHSELDSEGSTSASDSRSHKSHVEFKVGIPYNIMAFL